MQHPQALKAKVIMCQRASDKTPDEAAECEMILYAENSFVRLFEEQQTNPEKFGERVLTAQISYVKLRAAELKTQQLLTQLKANKASGDALRNAEDDVYKAKKAADEQWQMITVMLAVIGLTSPE